jgi:hypothetical protein
MLMAETMQPQEGSKRNRLAIASLVLGALSVAFAQFCHVPGTFSVAGCLGPIFALGSLTTGILGIREAKRLGGQGQKPAVGGLVTAGLGLLIFAAIFVPVMLTPGGLMTYVGATPTPTITPTPTMTPTPTPIPTETPPPTPTPASVTREGRRFAITFTDEWDVLDTSRAETCQEPNECLVIQHSSGDGIMISIVRIATGQEVDLEEEDRRQWASLDSVSAVSGPEVTEIGGLPAIKRIYIEQTQIGSIYTVKYLATEERDLYFCLIEAPAEEIVARHQVEIDGIIASIRFGAAAGGVTPLPDLESEPTSTPPPSAVASPPPEGYTTLGDDRFTLTYPSDWQELDTSEQQICKARNVTCFAVRHSTEDLTVQLTRYTIDGEPTAEEADQAIWNEITVPSYASVSVDERDTLMEIGGHPAVKRLFHGTLPSGEEEYVLSIIAVNGYDIYQFGGLTSSAEALEQYQEEMEEIISSVQFTD